MKTRAFLVLCMCLVASVAFGAGVSPLDKNIKSRAEDLRVSQPVILPIITWGGDIATIYANGNSEVTNGGEFGKKGMKFKITRMDDFQKQIELYLSGKTPYLRGTLGMINSAMDVLSRDPRTKPVVIYQLTWSSGGDCLVVKEEIGRASCRERV